MSKPIRLLVGLGNPGPEYQATRHNAGFWWIERLADAHRVSLREESKFLGFAGRLSSDSGEAWLLEPQTFMNASGRSVVALARFYKILPDEILVVHDELDLPPGTVKLKLGGGHGGHNGLRDIIAHLGSGDFWRLRLGIGHPGDRAEVVNYVLHRPRPDEDKLIDEALDRSLKLAPMLLAGTFEAAMHRLHSTPKAPKPPKPPKPDAGEAAEPNPGTPS